MTVETIPMADARPQKPAGTKDGWTGEGQSVIAFKERRGRIPIGRESVAI